MQWESIQIDPHKPHHRQVCERVRELVLTGQLKPGQKLPPTHELARTLGTHVPTVHAAMQQLVREGFLVRQRKYGTFVQSATDRMLLAVVFGPSLAEESAYFYRAVLKALRAEIEANQWTCRTYDGLLDHKGMPQPLDAPAVKQLRMDLRHHAFRALIEFAPGVKGLKRLEEARALPRVLYESSRPDSDVNLDVYRFGRESVEFLARRGRRRLAVVTAPMEGVAFSKKFDGLLDAVRELGLPEPRVLPIELTEGLERCEEEIHQRALEFIRAWGAGGPRPDGLVVDDDIAMRAVALALAQAGVRVPDEVQVVCLASDGVQLHYGVPVVRYEFSTRELARQLLMILQRRIQGEPLPSLPIEIQGRIEET